MQGICCTLINVSVLVFPSTIPRIDHALHEVIDRIQLTFVENDTDDGSREEFPEYIHVNHYCMTYFRFIGYVPALIP